MYKVFIFGTVYLPLRKEEEFPAEDKTTTSDTGFCRDGVCDKLAPHL